MFRVRNNEIAGCIEWENEFQANSSYGTKSGNNYIVKSYTTTIYSVGNGKIYFDNRFYSVTTSRLQNSIKQALKNRGVKEEFNQRKIYNLDI